MHVPTLLIHVNSAQLGLLFALQSLYIRRIDLDGSNGLTLHSGGYPIAVDYDYRFAMLLKLIQVTPSISCVLCHYLFFFIYTVEILYL